VDDYLALGETLARVELVDGNLMVSAPPNVRHQAIRSRVLNAIHDASKAVGLCALPTINLRLKRCRIYNPDFVIMKHIDLDVLVVDSSANQKVGEIVSPSSSSADRILKRHHYAEHGVVRIGQPLHLTEPVNLDLDPAVLLPRR